MNVSKDDIKKASSQELMDAADALIKRAQTERVKLDKYKDGNKYVELAHEEKEFIEVTLVGLSIIEELKDRGVKFKINYKTATIDGNPKRRFLWRK